MMPDFVSSYLEHSLKLFVNQQHQVREKVRDVVGVDPVGMVSEMAQKNYARWKSVQEDIFKTLNRPRGRESDKPGRKRAK